MKKTLGLLLAITLLSGMVFTSAYAAEESAVQDTYYEDTLTALGIMTGFEDSIGTDEFVTRGEFASILASIVGNPDVVTSDISWNEKYLGTEKEEQPIIYENSDKYIDVTTDNLNSNAINIVTGYGFMMGTTEKTFAPDEPIAYRDVATTLVRLAGYDVRAEHLGGYPTGYMEVAGKLKITSGVSLAQTDFVTFKDMTRLIYNTLDVDVLNIVAYGTETDYQSVEGETVLSEIMGIYKAEGVMTENDTTSLKSENTKDLGYAVIGGVELTFREDARHYRNYIGREVVAYYTMPKNSSKKTCIYLTSEDDDVLTINADDILSAGKGYFTYADDSDRVKKVTVDSSTSVIYNGVAKKSYSWDIFTPENGTVTVIENGEGDVVVINEYITFMVSVIDAEKMIIYNKAGDNSSATDDTRIYLGDEDKFRYSVRDKNGSALAFDDIKVGSVLSVSKNSKSADIILSDTCVQGEITAITDDKVEIEGTEYGLSSSLAKAVQAPKVEVGVSGNFFLDAFGKLAWFEATAEWECKKAYLVKVGNGTSALDNPLIKIFDFTDNTITAMKLAGNVNFVDANGKRKKISSAEVKTYLDNNYSKGLIGFLVNADNEITRIELPLDLSVNSNKGIYKIFESNDDAKSLYYHRKYHYNTSGSSIGGRIYLDSNTKVLIVPKDEADDDEYKAIKHTTFTNGLRFICTAYSMDADSPRADYLIAHAPDISTQIDQKTMPMVVTKISMTTDSNEEFVKKIEGIYNGNKVTYFAPFDKINLKGEQCTAIDVANDALKSKDEDGNLKEYVIEPGDVIRCAMGYVENTVSKVEIIFDYSAKNPYWKNTSVSGSIAGATGNFVYEEPFKGNMENPFAVYEDAPMNIGRDITQGEFRVVYGYVYSLKDGFMRITTQDIVNEEFDPDNMTFVNEYYKPASFASNLVTMRVGGRNLSAAKGTTSDIKAFLDVGSDCSRVIIVTNYGDPKRMIVINE